MNVFGAVAAWFTGRASCWQKVRANFLRRYPCCAACGGCTGLEVHHIIPVHVDPEHECDDANLISLCTDGPGHMNCHLVIGHCGNWKKWNRSVVADAARFLKMLREASI